MDFIPLRLFKFVIDLQVKALDVIVLEMMSVRP